MNSHRLSLNAIPSVLNKSRSVLNIWGSRGRLRGGAVRITIEIPMFLMFSVENAEDMENCP